MTRFKFLFAGLLGLGAKAVAQNASLSVSVEPCKPGDEMCPLGHAQKPELHQLSEWLFGEAIALSPQPVFLHICTVCRMVYSPKQKESVTF